MLELFLIINSVLLLLIYFQLRKNLKGADAHIAGLDFHLRKYFASVSNSVNEVNAERHKEICNHLDDISHSTQRTAKILSEVNSKETIEEQYEKNKPQWLPSPRIVD